MIPIVETFHSLQGEGHWTGTSAFFIRLAGCDVGCTWCDTKHSWATRAPSVSPALLAAEVKAANPQIVVVTGGEPLMHDLRELCDRLSGFSRHIETSGVHGLTGQWDWITLSPKPHKPPQPVILEQCHELKVVISSVADFEFAEQMAARSPCQHRYLQPGWGKSMEQQITEYIQSHPHWRLSLQTHKYLKIQ